MDSKIDWKKPLQIADGEYDTRGGMPVGLLESDRPSSKRSRRSQRRQLLRRRTHVCCRRCNR
jgi:hypothetical protein